MDNNLNTLPEIAHIGNERHYMLLQNCKAKVFLLSDKEGKKPYIVKVSNIKVKLNFFMESWVVMITYLSTPNYCPTLSCWLRSIDGGIGSDEINRFIQRVKKDHPLHPIEYSFKEVPVIATSKTYCELPSSMFRHPIKLTLEEEKYLLEVITSDKDHKKDELINWFNGYCNRYGVVCKYKRDSGSEAEELATMFCQIHGMLIYLLPRNPKPKESKFVCSLRALLIIIIAFVIIPAFGFQTILWAKPLGGFGGFVLGVIGLLMFIAPFAFIYNRFFKN